MLKTINIFRNIDDATLKEIERLSTKSIYQKKDVIFSEGDQPEWFHILTKGRLKITKLSYEGKEIILEIINAPDFFGGLAVLRGFPYPANAIALEDSEVLKIPGELFKRLVERYPSMGKEILSSVIDRIKTTHETLKNIALERVDQRIASQLIRLTEKYGKTMKEGILIDVKLTKQELADMVGTTVETAIRTMSKFKKNNLITEKNGRIIIKDIEGLKSMRGES